MARLKHIDDLGKLRERLGTKRKDIRLTVIVCGGTGCQASQSPAVIESIKQELARQGAEKGVHIRTTGCHGFCEQGPIMVFEPGNLFYCHVTPEDAPDIVSRTVMKGEVIERLLYKDPHSGRKVRKEAEIPFYQAQDRRLLSSNRLVDPNSIEDYIAIGGYTALAKVLTGMTPGRVIEEISASGLRGRGGAGFLTGSKWAECAGTPVIFVSNAATPLWLSMILCSVGSPIQTHSGLIFSLRMKSVRLIAPAISLSSSWVKAR